MYHYFVVGRKSKLLFVITYSALCFVIMFFVITEDIKGQLYIKPFISIILLLFYVFSVKKINFLFLLMLFSIGIGHYLMIFPKTYFIPALYAYLGFHLFTSILIFQQFLKNKSIFNVLSFSLPLFMIFLIFVLLFFENLESISVVHIFSFGAIICINGSVALLNYFQQQNIGNYLIFVGVYIIITSDACCYIYNYENPNNTLYYQLLVFLDFLGLYTVSRGVVVGQQKNEKTHIFLNN